MLVVKKSRIKGAGKGLFTTSRIRKGDLIVEYKGEKCTWKQLEKKYGKRINSAQYIYGVSAVNCIDAGDTPNELARYANDAEGYTKIKGLTNNSEYANIKGRPHYKPYIVATRDIPAGSEIFVDYEKEYWEAIDLERKV